MDSVHYVPFKFTTADKVLVIGHSKLSRNQIESYLTNLRSQWVNKQNGGIRSNGLVHFEQADRLPLIQSKEPLYSHAIVGYFNLDSQPHSNTVLSQLFSLLMNQGKVFLRELGLISRSQGPLFNLRTLDELTLQLKLSGFVQIQVNSRPLTSQEQIDLKKTWSWNSDSNLPSEIVCLEAIAEKPSYTLGTSIPLRKLKSNHPTAPTSDKVAIWTINAMDEGLFNKETEEELSDEDNLLDDSDLLKPIYSSEQGSSCETKKKACKNCSCGRAELEASMDSSSTSSITSIPTSSLATPSTKPKTSNFTSSCGSCYLGDAFRCASCPYLGLPAFKPGEQVVLKGNLMDDDIVL